MTETDFYIYNEGVYDGDFWDFYNGKPITEALPVGTVLTISAAGSEGSPDSVITLEKGMLKRGASGDAIRPKFSVLNPALTQTLPAYQTACGITDIIAHLYERYLTNTPGVVGGFTPLKQADVENIYRLMVNA